MKKIVSMLLIGIIGISIIPRTLINEKHVVLEGSTSVYTKEEVDNLLSTIRTNITNNTNEITNIKNEIKTLNDSLSDYVLKTELNETNSNIDDLNAILESNTARIEALESSGGGGEWELLWENPNKTSSWTQTAILEMDLTPYRYVAIRTSTYLEATDTNLQTANIFDLTGMSDTDTIVKLIMAQNGNNRGGRYYRVTLAGVTCDATATINYAGQGNTFTDTGYTRPIAVFGMK